MNRSNLNNRPRNYNLSEERMLMINILNTMYNENVRQINNLNDTHNRLIEINNQIRYSLTQIISQNLSQNNLDEDNNSINTTLNTGSFDRVRRNNYRNSRRTPVTEIAHITIPYNQLASFDGLTEWYNRDYDNRRNNNQFQDYLTQIFSQFMQPVEIYPTQDQIETATRRVRYGDIVRPINTSCPISMEEFNENDNVLMIRHCGHTFHTESLTNWFRTNCRCPVCRYDIRDYSLRNFFNSVDASNNII